MCTCACTGSTSNLCRGVRCTSVCIRRCSLTLFYSRGVSVWKQEFRMHEAWSHEYLCTRCVCEWKVGEGVEGVRWGGHHILRSGPTNVHDKSTLAIPNMISMFAETTWNLAVKLKFPCIIDVAQMCCLSSIYDHSWLHLYYRTMFQMHSLIVHLNGWSQSSWYIMSSCIQFQPWLRDLTLWKLKA